jgi:hypothetical protein
MGRIDIRGSRALQDVAIAINGSEPDVRRAIRAYSKSEMTRPWLEQINEEASSSVERRVISATATVAVSDQNIRIQAASKGRRLSGGLNPKEEYAPVEFGAKRGRKTTYTRKGHRVTRDTRAQFRPHQRSGYVFFPAARVMIPRLARLWVQTVVKTYADIFEGRG